MSCDDVRLKSIINLLPSISQRKPEEESVEESVPHVDQRIPVLTNIVVVDVVIVVVILHYVMSLLVSKMAWLTMVNLLLVSKKVPNTHILLVIKI